MSELEDQVRQQIRRMEIDLQQSQSSVTLIHRELDLIAERIESTEKVLSSIRIALLTSKAR